MPVATSAMHQPCDNSSTSTIVYRKQPSLPSMIFYRSRGMHDATETKYSPAGLVQAIVLVSSSCQSLLNGLSRCSKSFSNEKLSDV